MSDKDNYICTRFQKIFIQTYLRLKFERTESYFPPGKFFSRNLFPLVKIIALFLHPFSLIVLVCSVTSGTLKAFFSAFRSCEILVRIRHRILVFVNLIYGFGSTPDPDPALFISDFQDASNKRFFLIFFAY